MLRIKCHDCQRPFVITDEEIQRFKQQKVSIATTCKQCRKLEVIDQRLKRTKKLVGTAVALLESLLSQLKEKNATPKKTNPSKRQPKRLGK